MEARHASRTDLPRNQPANLPTFQRDVSWQCVGKHDGSPETYAAPETVRGAASEPHCTDAGFDSTGNADPLAV